MGQKLYWILEKNRLLVVALLFLFVFSLTLKALADPPTTPYTAPATLQPSCNVGDTNCTVAQGSTDVGDSIGSATAGSVFFAGTSGVLAQDNSNFFWDDTNNQLILSAGTAALPSITFAGDTDVGLFSSGSNQFSFTTNGVQRWTVTNTTIQGVTSGGPLLLRTGGSAATPSYSFVGDTNTGIYGSTDIIGFSTAGVERLAINASGNIVTPTADYGSGIAAPYLQLGRNSNATSAAGSIDFLSRSGTSGFVWQDNAGNMRIHTAAPSNANDTSGTVIGTQTSTRETKQDIESFTDYEGALQKIVDAPLSTFRYIKEVEGYGSDNPLAKARLGFIADEVDPIFMVGSSIDQVSVNGVLMAAVKELNMRLDVVELAGNIDKHSFGDALKTFFTESGEKIEYFVAKLITTDRLETKELCLDDLCITKEDLELILEEKNTDSNNEPTIDENKPSVEFDAEMIAEENINMVEEEMIREVLEELPIDIVAE